MKNVKSIRSFLWDCFRLPFRGVNWRGMFLYNSSCFAWLAANKQPHLKALAWLTLLLSTLLSPPSSLHPRSSKSALQESRRGEEERQKALWRPKLAAGQQHWSCHVTREQCMCSERGEGGWCGCNSLSLWTEREMDGLEEMARLKGKRDGWVWKVSHREP